MERFVAAVVDLVNSLILAMGHGSRWILFQYSTYTTKRRARAVRTPIPYIGVQTHLGDRLTEMLNSYGKSTLKQNLTENVREWLKAVSLPIIGSKWNLIIHCGGMFLLGSNRQFIQLVQFDKTYFFLFEKCLKLRLPVICQQHQYEQKNKNKILNTPQPV